LDGRWFSIAGSVLWAHVASLERKHADLERQLDSVLASPSSGDREIAELKRRKLRLKDEIERLRSPHD
jgi:hypothetical protein